MARPLTAHEAIKLVDLLHPSLLLIDPVIPCAFVAISHGKRLGVDVLVMSEYDVVLNRAVSALPGPFASLAHSEYRRSRGGSGWLAGTAIPALSVDNQSPRKVR